MFTARMQRRLSTSGALSVSVCTALTLLPVTQSSAQTAGAAVESTGLEEVVVTARRRNESLATVPIAITAIGGEQLVERSIRTDSDLQLAAPGLTIRQTQGNNSLTYSIRGQSADTFSGSPSAVIAYLNEVPLTIGSASSFYDLQSVQVLKGPQGTLFGRNTTGGAVLYTTAKPTDKFEALARVRVGNLKLGEIEGMLNVPLTDTVLLRGAVDAINRDGYIDNLLNSDKLGTLRRKSGRVTLTIKPTDNIENTTMVQYTDVGGTNTGASYTYSVYAPGQTNNGVALTNGAGFLFGPGLDVFGAGSWAAYLAAHPQAYAPGLVAYVDEQRRIGPYKTRHPGGARHEGKDLNVSNTTSVEINDSLTLKNILGVSHSKTDSEQPQLGAPFVTILTANARSGKSGNELDVKSFSDELQLQGKAFDNKFSYIAGYYFQRTKSDTLWPQTYFDVSPIIPPSYATNAFRIKNNTNAVYAQGTYDLSSWLEHLKFTAGLRYTWEHVTIEQLPGGDAFAAAGATPQSKNFKDPSWDVGLEYQATSNLFTYLKTRGSFRSGGFNGSAPPINATAVDGGNVFKSEHTKDVELGVKYRGDVFGRPATFNVAAYNQWVTDVQRVEFPDPDGAGPIVSIAVTGNVPKMEVHGLEFEASLAATSWLELGVSGAVTDAEFTDGRITLFGRQYSYGPVGDTPKHSGVVYAQLQMPVAQHVGEINLRGELYAQSAQYFSNAADTIAPGTRLPGYGLINSRLSWNDMFGTKLSSALFGKNLSDREYFVGGMTLAAALGHNAAAVGEPRTFGLELSYKY
jgi:iron complex outermembrane recepter protein